MAGGEIAEAEGCEDCIVEAGGVMDWQEDLSWGNRLGHHTGENREGWEINATTFDPISQHARS